MCVCVSRARASSLGCARPAEGAQQHRGWRSRWGGGGGRAAPQLGLSRQVLVAETMEPPSEEKRGEKRPFIHPTPPNDTTTNPHQNKRKKVLLIFKEGAGDAEEEKLKKK